MKVYATEYTIDFPLSYRSLSPLIKATLKVVASDMEFQAARGLRELAANALAIAMKDKTSKFPQDVHATLGHSPYVDIKEIREDFGLQILKPDQVVSTQQLTRQFVFDVELAQNHRPATPVERMEVAQKIEMLGIDLKKVEKEEEKKKLNIERKEAPWYE